MGEIEFVSGADKLGRVEGHPSRLVQAGAAIGSVMLGVVGRGRSVVDRLDRAEAAHHVLEDQIERALQHIPPPANPTSD